jgi:spore coat polysaccharide biosynthesis protein SpsF
MNSAILITARLKSERLPMKVIKPLSGVPMIIHMLDRLKLAKTPAKIIICTSTLDQDSPLEQIANQQGVECYRGDPDDVILRLTTAAKLYNVETVINCTADNPFVDPIYIDKLYQHHIKQNNEFSKIEGLPWGVFCYAMSRKAMEKVCEIKAEKDTEVWHGYFMETDQFKWDALHVTDKAVSWHDLRLTVDYPEDFALMERIFDELWDGESVFSLREIVALCRNHPEIVAINEHVLQKVGVPIRLKSGAVNG